MAFSQQAPYHVADRFCADETVTLAEVFPKVGALAVMVAEPSATPVTGTFMLVAPAANVTDKSTLETPGLLEFRLAVSPPGGAGADKFSARFCVVAILMVVALGEKLMVAATVFVSEKVAGEPTPEAEAVTA